MDTDETGILGWERLPSGNWRPIEELRNDYIYTAAFINCNGCGTAISGMGGPRSYALCLECFEQAEQNK
jgi:hypothetical protein